VSGEPRTTDPEEAVRRALEAGSGLDMAHVVRDDTAWAAFSAAITPFLAPDSVFEADDKNVSLDMAGQTYRGLEGFRRAITTFTEPAETMIYDLERIVGSGDRCASIYRVRARARHTGISFDFQMPYIWSLRDGRIVHVQAGFRDPAEALKVAGLEP
jgi:ketosteroid isomerase-like protein